MLDNIQTDYIRDPSEKDIKDFSNAFRETFANPPYGQYLLNLDNKQPISVQDFFETKSLVPIEQLDSLELQLASKKIGHAVCFWHDPVETTRLFRKKVKDHLSFLVLSRLKETGKVVGASFAYVSELGQAFRCHEEWANAYLYSGRNDIREERDLKLLLRCLEKIKLDKIQILKANTKVLIWNCTFTHSDHRSLEHLHTLLQKIVTHFDTSTSARPTFNETINGSTIDGVLSVIDFVDTKFPPKEAQSLKLYPTAEESVKVFGQRYRDFKKQLITVRRNVRQNL